MHVDKLKDFIRQKTKNQVSPATLRPLFEALPQNKSLPAMIGSCIIIAALFPFGFTSSGVR
jgi:hypothetical protein